MFNSKPAVDTTALQRTIDDLHINLDSDTGSLAFSNQIDQLTKLYSLKDSLSPKQVSADTKLIVAGNLLGILMILNHERANVVASKALSFVMKAKS